MDMETKITVLTSRVDRLEGELTACGIDKDVRIDNMHRDMNVMHTDMGAMKGTIESLTIEIQSAVESLKQIAMNTSNMREVAELYEKWKGFSWVMKNVGFWGAITIAFIAGVIAAFVKIG